MIILFSYIVLKLLEHFSVLSIANPPFFGPKASDVPWGLQTEKFGIVNYIVKKPFYLLQG